MSNGFQRARHGGDDEPDQWLLDAARRAGHKLPAGERPSGTSAWRMLLSAGVPDEEVLRIACEASGADAADFSSLSPALGNLLPHGVALKHRVAPLGVHRGTLTIATSNPRNTELERELAFAAKQRVRLQAASPTDVIRAQGVVYGGVYATKADSGPGNMFVGGAPPVTQPKPAPVKRLSLQMTVPEEDSADFVIDHGATEAMAAAPAPPPKPATTGETPVARRPQPAPAAPPARAAAPAPAAAPASAPAPDITERLLAAASAERASEALLEPTPEGAMLVRLRVDGTMNDRFRVPEAHTERLVETLKQRARLDPADATHPQQGRATYNAPAGVVSLRVSTEPLADGRERVRLRFFSALDLLGTGELGLSAEELHRFTEIIALKGGLVIVAGPGGSGHTTTLYAAARALRANGRSVTTVEELQEFPLEGIRQLAVRDGAAVAGTVRAALVESDAVVLGAPLDAATLDELAARGAGDRLVFASLPTADLPATLARLGELLPDRTRLARLLAGIVVQRLMRRLCPACASDQVVSELPEQQQQLLLGVPTMQMRSAVGCAECRSTGYSGRMAIAEVMPVTSELRDAIMKGAPSAQVLRVAREQGLTMLWDSGMRHVLDGTTSLAELLDTVSAPDGGGAPQEDIDALLAQLLGTAGTPADAPDAVAPGEAPSALGLVFDPVDDEPAVAVEGPAPVPVPPAPTPARSAPAQPGVLRVLVVDDDGAARRALAQELTAAGMQVLQAADGVSALAYARRLRPDLVLTEIALPGLDAMGLMAALREEANPPVVVVHTEQEDAAFDAWLIESGAHGVVRRGVAGAELVARLRAAARNKE